MPKSKTLQGAIALLAFILLAMLGLVGMQYGWGDTTTLPTVLDHYAELTATGITALGIVISVYGGRTLPFSGRAPTSAELAAKGGGQ